MPNIQEYIYWDPHTLNIGDFDCQEAFLSKILRKNLLQTRQHGCTTKTNSSFSNNLEQNREWRIAIESATCYTTYLKAIIPRAKKYAASMPLIKSLDRNLKRRKSDNKTALPIRGKRIACSFEIVSWKRNNILIRIDWD